MEGPINTTITIMVETIIIIIIIAITISRTMRILHLINNTKKTNLNRTISK